MHMTGTAAQLDGVAFVTGAAGGIGSITSLAYARAGVSGLYLTDLKSAEGQLAEVAKQCREQATNKKFKVVFSLMDVREEKQVASIVEHARETFGRIDYAANIAGVSEHKTCGIADCETVAFDEVMNVNVRGVFFCLRAEIQAMLKQDPKCYADGRPPQRGSIVNMASIASHTVIGPLPAYITSKHAVVGLTRAAAAAHAEDGIRVNTLCAGFIDTPLTRRLPEDTLAAIVNSNAQKRLGAPEEVAEMVIFLSGRQASFVTGKDWVADGGMLNMKL